MEYLFTNEQTQFRESLQNFFRKHSPTSEVRRLMETQLGFDREVWGNACGSLGLSGIAIPEKYGGSGFGPVELSIVCEEMGRSLYCGPFLGSVICAGSAINLSSANEETKEQYLSQIASGEIIAALAVTEINQCGETKILSPLQHLLIKTLSSLPAKKILLFRQMPRMSYWSSLTSRNAQLFSP